MQRRPALRVGVGVGAAFEQRRGQLVVRVHHREHERARAVGQRAR